MKRTRIIALCLVTLLCSGCRTKPAALPVQPQIHPEGLPEGGQARAEPVTLTLATTLQHRNKQQPSSPQWGEDPVSRLVGDMTGVSLIVEIGSEDIAGPHLADMLIASGEFPDLIYVSSPEDIDRLSDPSYTCPLDTLAAQYCPAFWDDFDPMERLNNTSEDGHIYALRKGYRDDRFYDDPNLPLAPPRMMALRTDWLEKMGAELPQSVEELEGLLYRAGERAGELGISVPLRLTGPLDAPLTDWMGLAQEPVWDPAAQKVCTPYRERGWLDYFLLLNQWYRDGVLGLPEGEEPWTAYIARTRDSAFATAYDNQKIYAAEALFVLREGAQEHDTPFPYAVIEQPLTVEGEVRLYASDHASASAAVSIHTGALMIGSSSIKQDHAIRFVQFLAGSEGAQLTRWGIEGVHYERTEDGGLRFIGDYRYPDNYVFNAGTEKRRMAGIDYWLLMENTVVNGLLDASPEAYYTNSDRIALRAMEIRAGQRYKTYAAQNRNPVLAFAEIRPGHALEPAAQRIRQAWEQAAWEMVTAGTDQEAVQIWETLQAQLKQLGLDEVEAAMTEQYLSALERYQQAGYLLEK